MYLDYRSESDLLNWASTLAATSKTSNNVDVAFLSLELANLIRKYVQVQKQLEAVEKQNKKLKEKKWYEVWK